MTFNSYLFIFIFLPVTLIVFQLLKNRAHKYLWLTIASYIFYGYWDYKYCLLLVFCSIVGYYSGLYMLKNSEDYRKKKFGLLGAVIPVLGLLLFFKYYNFGVQGVNYFLHLFSFKSDIPLINIILPVGISFYVFQTLSYILDVYYGRIEPTKNILDFFCYVSMFPQVLSGPIVRFSQISKDMNNIDKADKYSNLHKGLWLFVLGLAKKLIIADSVAKLINPMFADYQNLGTLDVWLAVLGYTYQLYFDFSGYSDMAIGIAAMFGFNFPANFNSPYKSVNISDFWRRWHISLSSWFRDYLFMPLQIKFRYARDYGTVLSLFIVFALCGLWHGAALTFIVWGAYHGVLLGLYHLYRKKFDKLNIYLRRGITFILVVIGWAVFRSDSMMMAYEILKKMFIPLQLHSYPVPITLLVTLAVLLGATNIIKEVWEYKFPEKPAYAAALAVIFVICLLFIGASRTVFLYFQF